MVALDARNWDEESYKATIYNERESQCRTIFRAIFSPNENNNNTNHSSSIVTASSDGSVTSFSLSSCLSNFPVSSPHQIVEAKPTCLLRAHEGPAYDVKFYGHGPDSLLLSCGDDGRIRGWKWKDLEDSETPGRQLDSFVKPVVDLVNPQHRGPWSAMSPIPENNAIAVDEKEGSIYVAAGNSCAYSWDLESCKIKMVFKGHSDYLHCIVSRQQSNQIVTGSEDGTARIWDCRSGKCVQVVSPYGEKGSGEVSSVRCVALDDSGSWLACGRGRSLYVWNLLAAEEISRISSPTVCQDVVFDGNDILTVGAAPVFSRLDMNGKILSQIKCAPQSAFSVSAHRSGVVAVAGYGGLVDVISQFGSHMCMFRCASV